MANKKISELQSRTPSLTDLLLVGDPSSGYSYKCTVTALATIIETDIADGYVTIGTTQTISGAKTFSNNLTLTSVSNANTDTDKFLVLNASNIVNFRTGAEVLSDIGGQGALTLTTTGTSGAATLVSNVLNIPQYQGVISLASIGSSPNANGATLSSNTLTLQPASGSFGGVVTTGFQEFAGQKRFIGNPIQFDKHLEVKNIDSWGVSWGYTSLASKDTPVFGFLRGHSFVGTVTYYAWFTYGSTGERNYTLPSTDGTLALTSDITSSISGTANYIPKFTGSNSIGNSVIYESSSNIGIGTTSPANRFTVAGAGGAAYVRVEATDATLAAKLQARTATSAIELGAVSNNPVVFVTNDTERMRLDASGNLGIGTTSPSYKLQVEGAFGTNPGAYVSGTTYGTIGANRGASSASAGLNLYSVGSQKWFAGIYENSDNFGFYSVGTNSFPMVINYSTGNVGIGTTTPESYYSGADNLVVAQGSGEGGITIATANNTTGALYFADGTTGTEPYRGGIAYTHSIDVLTLVSGGAEKVRITSAGNVGIGTTSPSNKLEVVGRTAITDANQVPLTINNTGQRYTQFDFLNNGTQKGSIWIDNTDASFNFYAVSGWSQIFSTNATERMRITSGGNVGIGTTAPQLNLHIFTSGTSFTSSTVTYSSATSRGILLDNSAGTNQSGNAIWFANSGLYSAIASTRESTGDWGTDIRFYTHPTTITNQYDVTERMRITSGGNVLIGTTTGDGYKLQLVGNSQASSTFGQTYSTVAAYSQWVNSSGAFVMGLDGANGSTERMRITSGGEVYIAGTTDQGAYNLQVNGTGVWGAGAYVNGSDRSLKENIYDLDGCLELVKQLKPVTYKYKESYSKDTSTQTGFIAQDLKELFKDKSYLNGLVKEGGQHLSVAYQNLIPLLVKAIQEQQAEIEILKNK